MLKSLLVATAAATMALTGAPSESKPLQATAKLDASSSGPVISRFIYGQFSEHLGSGIYDGIWVGPDSSIPNVRGIRTDVVKALKAIHVPLVRWPGGCFADEYVWRDGVGNRNQRPVRKNNWWGDAPETNAFGTHEFMDFVEQIGSDAYVSVNVGSSTPKDMREWMEYMTSPGQDTLANERRANGRDKPWNVALWGVGNESWGCGGGMRPEYYADEFRKFRAFAHKSPTNQGLIIASGSNADDLNWTEVLMKNAAGSMDGLSLHYYTLPTGNWDKKGAATDFGEGDWINTLFNTLKMDSIIKDHAAIMDKYDPKKRVGLYIDEWGTWYDVEKGTNPGFLYQQNTLRDGVVAAANLNIFHRYADRVKMTSVAQTINVLQAMILTDGSKMALTPTYYVFKMYIPFQDATFLPLNISAPDFTLNGKTIPSLSATAAKAKDGHVYIGLTNMNPRDEVSLTLDLAGLKVKSLSGEVLTAPTMDAHNIPGQKEAISLAAYKGGKITAGKLSMSLPAKSVVVVRLD